MNNNVVSAVFDSMTRQGFSAVKFNFRGIGGSSGRGTFNGSGEREDVMSVCSFIEKTYSDSSNAMNFILVGYSYGSLAALGEFDHPANIENLLTLTLSLSLYSSLSSLDPKCCLLYRNLVPLLCLLVPHHVQLFPIHQTAHASKECCHPQTLHYWRSRHIYQRILISKVYCPSLKHCGGGGGRWRRTHRQYSRVCHCQECRSFLAPSGTLCYKCNQWIFREMAVHVTLTHTHTHINVVSPSESFKRGVEVLLYIYNYSYLDRQRLTSLDPDPSSRDLGGNMICFFFHRSSQHPNFQANWNCVAIIKNCHGVFLF